MRSFRPLLDHIYRPLLLWDGDTEQPIAECLKKGPNTRFVVTTREGPGVRWHLGGIRLHLASSRFGAPSA